MSIQLQKVLRDLWVYRLRTGLSIFAICVGLVVFGGLATVNDLVLSTYESEFRNANPAQVMMQLGGFEDSLLRRLQDEDGIQSVDAHYVVADVRISFVLDEWVSLELHVSDDYSTQQLHRIFAEPDTIGVSPPRGTIWLDRSILQRNALAIGDWVTVQNSSGDIYTLQISGFVNDVIAFPSQLSDQAVAYISFDTLRDMKMATFSRARNPVYNRLYLRFDAATRDVLRIRQFVQNVESRLLTYGYQVASTEYLSDEPPLQIQISAIGLLLVISTILSFGVTGVMIGNFVSAIVGRQINEIGIMKSLGAVPSQIIRYFSIMMIIMGLIAFVIAVPLTAPFANQITNYLTTLIDIDLDTITVSMDVRIVQFIAALMLPLVASLIPVIQGSSLTVRETLRNDGNASGRFVRWLFFFQPLIPTIIMKMASRNIFLKPGRFLLTTISLTLPGALFIASFGIDTALQTLDANLANSLFNYDIEFVFDGYQPIKKIQQIAEKQAGVQYVEAWRQGTINRVYGIPSGQIAPPPPINNTNQNQNISPPVNISGTDNRPPPPDAGAGNRPPPPNAGAGNRPPPPQNTNSGVVPTSVVITAIPQQPINGVLPPPPPDNREESISGAILLRGVPIDSRLLYFSADKLTSGSWLQDSNDLLLTYEGYYALSINVDRSSSIWVRSVTGEDQEWDVVGVTGQMLVEEGFIDINRFDKFIPAGASTIRLAIVTSNLNDSDLHSLIENLRDAYNHEGIAVNSSISIRQFVAQRSGRINLVTQTLILLSLVIGSVSVIGLISTISINIRERTKSIGIIRSLGGDYRHLIAMVLAESMTIVVISYGLALGLSFWVGDQIASNLSMQIYSLRAVYQFEPFGGVLWLGVMILAGIVATLGPALYAINLTISDTLRYEG